MKSVPPNRHMTQQRTSSRALNKAGQLGDLLKNGRILTVLMLVCIVIGGAFGLSDSLHVPQTPTALQTAHDWVVLFANTFFWIFSLALLVFVQLVKWCIENDAIHHIYLTSIIGVGALGWVTVLFLPSGSTRNGIAIASTGAISGALGILEGISRGRNRREQDDDN
jgi:L-cystine uptake protein TcyP (sodium:dicarboxylate symporter family)